MIEEEHTMKTEKEISEKILRLNALMIQVKKEKLEKNESMLTATIDALNWVID